MVESTAKAVLASRLLVLLAKSEAKKSLSESWGAASPILVFQWAVPSPPSKVIV